MAISLFGSVLRRRTGPVAVALACLLTAAPAATAPAAAAQPRQDAPRACRPHPALSRAVGPQVGPPRNARGAGPGPPAPPAPAPRGAQGPGPPPAARGGGAPARAPPRGRDWEPVDGGTLVV
ncbi:hypothetical protein ABWI14_35860, partial [Streptomyces capoamus]